MAWHHKFLFIAAVFSRNSLQEQMQKIVW